VRRVIVSLLLGSCLGPVLELPAPHEPVKSAAAQTPRVIFGKSRPARAFVIESTDDLLDGPAADGEIGDYALDNGIVRVIVARPDHVLGFADSGGHVIDAGPSGGQDALMQLFELTGAQFPRQALYDQVIAEQRQGAAVVRATGHDSEDKDLNIVTEYVLPQGARAVEITTTYLNAGSSPMRSFAVGEAIQWGRAERFIPEQGFSVEATPRDLTTPEGWLLGVAPKVSYAYAVNGPLAARHGAGWSNVKLGELALLPGAAAKIQRWLIVSPTPDVSLGEALASLRGQSWARLTGRIGDGGEKGVSGVRLMLSDRAGKPIALAQSLTDGAYAQVLPPGDYLVSSEAVDRSGPQRLEVKLAAGAATTLDVILTKPGSLRYQVDEGGRASPAKLTFFGLGQTRTPTLGHADHSPGENVVLTASGRGTLPLPPGRYRVFASRGPTFTLDEKEIEVTPDAPAQVSFKLARAVELPGLVCADPHQHAAPSADSGVEVADRVRSNLAEGLDVEIATDHNQISGDYAEALGTLEAARPLLLLTGDELTREGAGHFNAWPIRFDDNKPHGGAPPVRGKSVRELLAEAHAPDRVVAVNHPRAGTIGYFNLIGFDPRSPQLPRGWEGGFDAVEVFTGKDPSKSDDPIADWMALTNRGLIYTAVGGSDSHLIWGQEVGYPRTCVFLDGAPSATALVAAIRGRREALVTNGPFVTVSIGGKGMGQIVAAPRGKVRLDVEVRAAPWVDARKLEIFVNGERRGKAIDIPSSHAPLRYQAGHELKIDHDAAVVVIVRGEASLEPVVSRPEGAAAPTPLAITNPIFVDRDGDGRFTAPHAGGPTRPPPHR
jgi:hypothetical protein